jgi:hypothetical protein
MSACSSRSAGKEATQPRPHPWLVFSPDANSFPGQTPDGFREVGDHGHFGHIDVFVVQGGQALKFCSLLLREIGTPLGHGTAVQLIAGVEIDRVFLSFMLCVLIPKHKETMGVYKGGFGHGTVFSRWARRNGNGRRLAQILFILFLIAVIWNQIKQW